MTAPDRDSRRATAPGRGPRRPSAPPAALDPVFALIERIDRRRRGIRPLRPGGVLGIETRRYHGREVDLRDGERIRPGDRIIELHLENARIAGVWATGWRATFGAASEDLRACAAWVAAQAPEARPVAVHAGGLLTVGAARLGFEVGPPRPGFMGALESWYLRGLLARWSLQGRARLDHGREPLRSREAWLPTRTLLARYAPAAQAVPSSSGGPSADQQDERPVATTDEHAALRAERSGRGG